MSTEPFQLPGGVPILGASTRTDEQEAIARLALAVAVLANEMVDKMGHGKASFILAAIQDVLDRFGPIDPDHEFDG